MTVLETIQRSADFLEKKEVDSPRLQAELLLAHVLGMPRMKLYLNFERPLTEPETNALRDLLRRRARREPLQHILGTVNFCGLELAVDSRVLVPRPETELLAERAWKFLNSLQESGVNNPTALDFGTGSGCLAIALATKCPAAVVHALDVSPDALEVARANAQRCNVADRIHFHEGDGFAALAKTEPAKFHLIASNPPYIPSAEIADLQPEVRDHDPRSALDGGADGLDVFRHLASEAGAFLHPGGQLMAEFGDGQGPSLRTLFAEHGWTVQGVEPDDSGRERFLVVEK